MLKCNLLKIFIHMMVHHKVLLCKNTFYKDPNNGVINYQLISSWASQVVLVVKNLCTNAGDAREEGSVPGPGRCPGEENGTPLQYSYLENPMDRGAWWATVHGAAKSQA